MPAAVPTPLRGPELQLPTPHELKDDLVLIAGLISATAAIVMPWLLNRDTKRTMAVSWGKFTERVDSHGARLDKVEDTLVKNTEDIGYVKGRLNGAAIH